MPLLVDCPVHGFQPASNMAMQILSGTVTVKDVAAPCALCGRSGPLIDGDYTGHGPNRTTAVLRPTPAQLRRLQTAAAAAQQRVQRDPDSAEIVAARLRKTAEREAPGLLKAVDAITSPRALGLVAWIGLIVALIGLLTSGQSDLTQEDVVRIVEQVQQADQDARPTSSLPPSPTPAATPPADAATTVPTAPASPPPPPPAPPTEPPRGDDSPEVR